MDRLETKTFSISTSELDFLSRYGAYRSSQLREDICLLQTLIRYGESQVAGRFTISESCFMIDVLNEMVMEPSLFASYPIFLATEVSNACKLEEMDQKWGVDGKQLEQKCRDLSPIQAYAIYHLTRIYWMTESEEKDGGDDIEKRAEELFHCEE